MKDSINTLSNELEKEKNKPKEVIYEDRIVYHDKCSSCDIEKIKAMNNDLENKKREIEKKESSLQIFSWLHDKSNTFIFLMPVVISLITVVITAVRNTVYFNDFKAFHMTIFEFLKNNIVFRIYDFAKGIGNIFASVPEPLNNILNWIIVLAVFGIVIMIIIYLVNWLCVSLFDGFFNSIMPLDLLIVYLDVVLIIAFSEAIKNKINTNLVLLSWIIVIVWFAVPRFWRSITKFRS